MEALAETKWDIIISGTGLPQSLLALALSRSGKNILHVDQNSYYGGPEAAFSLQEAKEWASSINQESRDFPFEDAAVVSPGSSGSNSRLSASRAYTLPLSPQIIYSRSRLIPMLVSSKVYRQLEFQAVGSWWIYKPTTGAGKDLYRVPGSREDVFADDSISIKSKRTLMRFLRHLRNSETNGESGIEEEDLTKPLSEYLTSKFQVPPELYNPLLSLALSQVPPQQTSTKFAVPRIQRHLTSIGIFGPGFGSVLAKWGGGSEISQVGCRALAVGGGVYVLNAGIESTEGQVEHVNDNDTRINVHLSNGEMVSTRFIVGSTWDLPASIRPSYDYDKVAKSVTIVSSPLENLFPATAEGGPIPAGAVVAFPASSLGHPDDTPPVYISVHSGETAECPVGQSVLFGSVSIPGQEGQSLIDIAIRNLLQSSASPDAEVLWSLRYTQLGRADSVDAPPCNMVSGNIITFPPSSLDLSFDDSVIDLVRDAWKLVMEDDATEEDFMNFNDRENYDDD